MLKIKNISFARENPILKDINFSLKKGDFFGIVGPSGAGKSTLLKIISGLLDADKGSVILDGNIILGPKDKLIAGNSEIQLLNQDFALDIYHTVYENLLVKTPHLKKKIQHEFIEELLELVGLQELKTHKAIELSGGEQQRLSLARALALEPKILLLDEPFAHLDAHIKRKLIQYLLELNRVRKTTLILVSHDGQEMLSLASKIAYFDEGKMQRIDSPKSFYFFPNSYQEALLFGQINKIILNKKEILFRPNQFSTEITDERSISLNIKYIKQVFYGNYSLALFSFKNQIIYLNVASENLSNGLSENLEKIYIKG
jgi:ABC-type Fe3+/spermidine/putrescine transport system ATPase subunit